MEVSRFRTKVSSFEHLDEINSHLDEANSLSDDSHFERSIPISQFEIFLAELVLFYWGVKPIAHTRGIQCPNYGQCVPKLGALSAQAMNHIGSGY